MSGSREESPDWLRSFQAPTRSALVLSSGSESLPDDAPVSEDENLTTSENPLNVNEELVNKTPKAQSTSKKPISSRKRKKDDQIKEGSGGVGKVVKQKTSAKASKPNEPNLSIWTLSSDSESCPDGKEDKDEDADLIGIGGQSLVVDASKEISLEKDDRTKNQTAKKRKNNSHMDGAKNNMEIAGEEMREKESGPYVSSSRLPLVLSEKVQRSKALVECEGESIDLSGDVGAVGRVVISDDASGNNEMLLDLKGTIYKTTIVPSWTFCVVSFGQSEAKIEAIMNDFIQLKPQSNVYEAETMVEGTLEGFSFDLEDDAEKLPKPINKTDETEGAEEKSNGKTGGKLEKTSGLARKKGKTTGGKPQKKAKKKSQVPKKTRARK